MQSDTPRTDAENCIRDMGFEKWVSIDFARELERELAAAKKQRDEARRWYCRLIAYQRQDRGEDFDPEAVAVEEGWDCYEEKEGGGA